MIGSLYDIYKHWSFKGSVFILSDTHFDDKDCKLMDNNWVSAEEQVSIINSMVHKNDTLILLGDVGDLSYVKQLKAGYKVLIMGNHDESTTKFKKVYWVEEYSNTEHKWIRCSNTEYNNQEDADKFILMDSKKHYKVKDNGMFDEVYEGPIFISEKIVLSHEPIYGLDWCFNIHGHEHDSRKKNDIHHLNLAANVIGYAPLSLKDIIKSGVLSHIKTIHRKTIDKATKNKLERNS